MLLHVSAYLRFDRINSQVPISAMEFWGLLFFISNRRIDMADKREPDKKPPGGEDVSYLKRVQKLVEETKYGTITIVIQDGRVVQVDRTEKFRL